MSTNITIDEYVNDIKLEPTKSLTQSISCIDWSTHMHDHFACTLWDGTLKIFQVASNQSASSYRTTNYIIKEKASLNITTPYPLTSCVWSPDGNAIFVGSSKGEIKALDANSGHIIDIGSHQTPINYLKFIPEHGNTLLSSAYERNVNFWNVNVQKPIQTVNYSSKIFKASLNGGTLATAHAGQTIGLVNLKALHKKTQNDSSELGKHSPLQSIQVSKNGKVVGLGTVDGRVNVSFIQSNSMFEHSLKTHITFKAQKIQEKDEIVLYPVNSINFNNANEEWFSTCGADGTMHFWNHKTKSKLKQFSYNRTPVCCSKTSETGRFIAYSLGNDWHIGAEGQKWKPRLAVHEITSNELRTGIK